MKFSKELRDRIGTGCIFIDNMNKYKVMSVSRERRGINVTLQIIDSDDNWLKGRTIYREPLSLLYGCELVIK